MYVEIEMGGKTRKLRYDFNAIADIERRPTGMEHYSRTTGRPSLHPDAIWGGLKWQDKG